MVTASSIAKLLRRSELAHALRSKLTHYEVSTCAEAAQPSHMLQEGFNISCVLVFSTFFIMASWCPSRRCRQLFACFKFLLS